MYLQRYKNVTNESGKENEKEKPSASTGNFIMF
jgi:hypothetical protein